MAKKRKPNISIFIACEGSNTEPLYFEKLNETMEDHEGYPYAITVYPDKDVDNNPKTDAIGLINVAVEKKEEFDELWVVFDKDGYKKHKEAFELADRHEINIAFSSISFEMWVLLHFERNNTSYPKSANIIREKFLTNEKYLDDYTKSGDYNLYPKIQSRTKKAFENVTWLRNWLKSNNAQYMNYMSNPYSDVDFLVKKLQLDDSIYEYRELNQALIFLDVEILVSYVDGEVVVRIINGTNTSLVWNEFNFYDDKMIQNQVVNSLIQPGDTSENNLGTMSASKKLFLSFRKLRLEVNLEL
ncbi:MAG: RloB family protein [Fulvivirga sp.]